MPGIDACLVQAMEVPGALGASIVDWTSGLALGSAGDSPGGDVESTAAETAELARMAAEYRSFTADPPGAVELPEGGQEGGQARKSPAVEDLIVTTPGTYHLMRFVETGFDSSVFLHLWLDRDAGNLALARLRMADLADRMVLG
ncbi:hypothetical protein DY218_29475 [Streptomyces triticagri]|uniref:Roadblock/LC7 domain-containing protein n=1 Tax=Streptomyces triticagri TaxID=2293568 RepID=A0A372LXI9_9ACTN|nr:hypothetical protein [Streptomyces triticagri]RFU83120.1 hypothetical protein DY218_29475 [Streptomyces triticagri]